MEESMKSFNETFKNCKYLPLTREEMIDMIEGRVVRRPAIAMGSWIQPELLAKEKQLVYKEKILDVYPEDMQQFYIKKPSTFGKRGDKYTWCDVDGADPHIGRTEVVAVDEIYSEKDIEAINCLIQTMKTCFLLLQRKMDVIVWVGCRMDHYQEFGNIEVLQNH